MTFPSRNQYRALVATSIVIYLATLTITELGLVPYAHDIQVAREWNHFNAMLPFSFRFVWQLASAFLLPVSLGGMLFFWSFARWVLATLFVLQVFIAPYMGLLVLTPTEHFLSALTGLLASLVLMISIFSPLATEFGMKRVSNSGTPVSSPS